MIIDFNKGNKDAIVLSLGYFDSVHRGHRFLIERARDISREIGANSAVFTFSNNIYKIFNEDEGQVYTFSERCDILHELGVSHIIYAVLDEKFMSLSPIDFLNKLTEHFNIQCIVCGTDFRFGSHAKGNYNLLIEYCNKKNISCEIYDMVLDNGIKISTSTIRDLLIDGRIDKANALLGSPFSISGTVISGKGQGRFMGFPTANLELNSDKLKIAEGVYATTTTIDGKIYESLTNVGGKPTFEDYTYSVETFVIDYIGEALYNKVIKVSFYDRIRSICKYQNKEELSLQIKLDLAYSKSIRRS